MQVEVVDVARIRIGEVYSYRTPESWEENPDDRQERIEVIGGVVVQDYGVIEEGKILKCQALFKVSDWENVIKNYWKNRTRVTVTDESGKEYSNVRVVYKGRQYLAKFPAYTLLTLEFWFC